VGKAEDTIGLRTAESQAAAAYWRSWERVRVRFTQSDEHRVPAHWLAFGPRTSPLTSSPRLAANPGNALLNYLYAILEAEARLALLAVGCDPGLGIQHADQTNRDSMACDVMEAVRPQVDAWLLDYLGARSFAKRDFVEVTNGHCRLMPRIAQGLAQTARLWAKALGPVVEDIAQRLHRLGSEHGRRRWLLHRAPSQHPKAVKPLPTRLTEQNRRRSHARGGLASLTSRKASSSVYSAPPDLTSSPIVAARPGVAATTEAELVEHQQFRLARLVAGLEPLTRESFLHVIVPALRAIPAEKIAAGVGLSVPYCAKIRAGRCVPNHAHWPAFRAAIARLDEL
jgi:hypothetical protein